MFDIGFVELLLLGTIALLVLGPERLPHAARLAGGLIAKSRRALHDLKHTMDVEMQAHELKERLKQIEQAAKAAQDTMQSAESELKAQCSLNSEPTQTPSEPNTKETTQAPTMTSIPSTHSPESIKGSEPPHANS